MSDLSKTAYPALPIRPRRHTGAAVLFLLLLAGCAQPEPAGEAAPASPVPATEAPPAGIQAGQDPAQTGQGAQIFGQYCAGCHGPRAEGTPNGPSLDGTGHSWHHPLNVLRDKTENGFRRMPAFKDQLSDRQIDEVISWFQSLWPDEVYKNWQRRWHEG